MRIFSRKTLTIFWVKFPDSKEQLIAWYDIIKKTEFKNSNEVKEIFGSADFVGDGKVIYNICGNKYRLIARMRYDKHLVLILFIGTHKEYDNIDVKDL